MKKEMERFIMWLNTRRACEEGMIFVKSCESFEEFYEKCSNGTWLTWLFERTELESKNSIIIKAKMVLALDEFNIINETRHKTITHIIELCERGKQDKCIGIVGSNDMLLWSIIHITSTGAVSYANFLEMYDTVDEMNKFLSRAASEFRRMVPIDSIKRPWND